MFRLPLQGLDLYRTRGQAAAVVNLRRRLTRSEAAKQEAESQTNRGRTKFPRDRVQEVRHLAATLTAGLSFDTLFSLILNFARSLSLVQVDSSGFLHITKYVWGFLKHIGMKEWRDQRKNLPLRETMSLRYYQGPDAGLDVYWTIVFSFAAIPT